MPKFTGGSLETGTVIRKTEGTLFLLDQIDSAVAGVYGRVYHSRSQGTIINTWNARWDSDLVDFVRDVNTENTWMIMMGPEGKISRSFAKMGAGIIVWIKLQDVTKYSTENIILVSTIPGWTNTTDSFTTVTGITSDVLVEQTDLVKIKAEGSFEKTGTSSPAEIGLFMNGSAIASSMRRTSTASYDHPIVSISTSVSMIGSGTITFDLRGRVLVSDGTALSTVNSPVSLQIELIRQGNVYP